MQRYFSDNATHLGYSKANNISAESNVYCAYWCKAHNILSILCNDQNISAELIEN